jgi:hypothetical protein
VGIQRLTAWATARPYETVKSALNLGNVSFRFISGSSSSLARLE